MPIALLDRPAPTEYAPNYAGYVAGVPEGDVLATLAWQLDDTVALLTGIPESRALHRYALGKWSVKEVVGHIADTERIMSYRALRIARGDATPLAGFDENDYVRGADFDARPLAALASELEAVRRATLSLFRSLDETALVRRGVANGLEVTPRALAYIIAGHERHHVALLRSRYLSGR